MLLERPLGRKEIRCRIHSCIEKKDLVQVILDYMPLTLGTCTSNNHNHSSTNISLSENGNHDVNEGDAFEDGDGENLCANENDHGNDDKNGTCSNDKVLRKGFQHLWFGSYASSIIDSKRTIMTLDELLSLNGFSMNFKVITSSGTASPASATFPSRTSAGNASDFNLFSRQEEQGFVDNDDGNSPSSRNRHHRFENILRLHFHCICYFYEDHTFRMESDSTHYQNNNNNNNGHANANQNTPHRGDEGRIGRQGDNGNDNNNHRPEIGGQGERQQRQQSILSWKWVEKGRVVQIGQYQPLQIYRMKNWGWKLENCHVVLLSH